MKIKLDENLPDELADLLAADHDVHTVRGESLAGRDDRTVFAAAVRERRVLITQDLDFSDLRHFKPGTHPGIVLVRLHDSESQASNRTLPAHQPVRGNGVVGPLLRCRQR